MIHRREILKAAIALPLLAALPTRAAAPPPPPTVPRNKLRASVEYAVNVASTGRSVAFLCGRETTALQARVIAADYAENIAPAGSAIWVGRYNVTFEQRGQPHRWRGRVDFQWLGARLSGARTRLRYWDDCMACVHDRDAYAAYEDINRLFIGAGPPWNRMIGVPT